MLEAFPVRSTAVSAIAYDAETGELVVRFRNKDRTYVYRGVEPWRLEELLGADSIGAYVNRHIKPHYRFDEIAPPRRPRGRTRRSA